MVETMVANACLERLYLEKDLDFLRQDRGMEIARAKEYRKKCQVSLWVWVGVGVGVGEGVGV